MPKCPECGCLHHSYDDCVTIEDICAWQSLAREVAEGEFTEADEQLPDVKAKMEVARAIVAKAEAETERLRAEGWTKKDFAKALDDMFKEGAD